MERILLILLSVWAIPATQAQTNDCQVYITGLKSNSGTCIFYLYREKKGFPTESRYAIATISAAINAGKSTASFKGLASGEYAIAVIHDENDNGILDTNFLGIPKEGIGTSNNARSTLGPPGFEDSRFIMGNNVTSLNITIKYL